MRILLSFICLILDGTIGFLSFIGAIWCAVHLNWMPAIFLILLSSNCEAGFRHRMDHLEEWTD